MLWGWQEGIPGGAALRRCENRLSSGALPPPAARPLGGLLRSATHVLWARVCGRRGPALSIWLACPARGCVLQGWWEAIPGGVAFQRHEGRLVSGAVPAPAVRPLGRAARVPRPGQWFPGAVGVGVGTQHRSHSVRSCEPSLRAVGMAGGRFRGGCLSPLWGASEFRRSPSPGCPSSGRPVRVCYPRAVGPGVRVWGPSTVHLICMPCEGLRAAGVVGGLPGGIGLPPL